MSSQNKEQLAKGLGDFMHDLRKVAAKSYNELVEGKNLLPNNQSALSFVLGRLRWT